MVRKSATFNDKTFAIEIDVIWSNDVVVVGST